MVHHTWLFTWALEVEFRSLCLCAMDLSKFLSSYYTFNHYLIQTSIYFIVGWRNGSEVKLLQRIHTWLPAPMLYNSQLSITPKGSNASAAICNSHVCIHAQTHTDSKFILKSVLCGRGRNLIYGLSTSFTGRTEEQGIVVHACHLSTEEAEEA